MRFASIALVTSALVTGCGKTSTSPSPSPTSSAASPSGSVRGALVRTEQAGGTHEVPDTRAVVRFANVGGAACIVGKFHLRWGASGMGSVGLGAGSAACDGRGTNVPVGASVEIACVIPTGSMMGAAPGMTPSNTKVEALTSNCALTS